MTRPYAKGQVEISIRDRVGQGLKAIEKRMTAFGSRLTALGGAVAGAGTAGIAAFTGLASQFAGIGDELQKMGIRVNASAQFLSEMAFAAGQSGTDINQLGAALFRMNRRVANAQTQTGPAVRALEELGLSAKRLGQLSTEDRLLAIADALGQMPNEARAAQLGFELFGDNFRQIQPLLAEGSTGINALRSEARALGVTMSQADAEGAAALTDGFGRMAAVLKGVTIQIGAAVAPIITDLANVFARTAAGVVHFIRENRELIQTAFFVAVALAGIGSAMVAAGVAVIGLGVVIGSVTTIAAAAFSALATVVGILTSPITLVAATIGGLAYLALEASGGLQVLAGMFGQLGQTASTTWGGIVAAVRSGDLQLAGQIAFLGLQVAYSTVMDRLRQVWAGLVFFLQTAWRTAVLNIVEIGAAIYFGVARNFDMLATTLQGAFDVAFVYIRGAIDSIVTQIAKAIIKAQEFFGFFSAEESARVQQSLDDDLARRAGTRQTGLDRRADDRQTGLDQRDANRRQTQADFSKALGDTLRIDRQPLDTSQSDAARDALADKQAELAEKVAQAQAELKKATDEANQETPSRFAELPRFLSNLGEQTSKTKAIGTSSAAAVAAGVFGVGPQRFEEETAGNTRRMADGINRLVMRPQPGLK